MVTSKPALRYRCVLRAWLHRSGVHGSSRLGPSLPSCSHTQGLALQRASERPELHTVREEENRGKSNSTDFVRLKGVQRSTGSNCK